MAIMWPRKVPPDVRKEPDRRAECKVFDRLESVLDDTFSVFYSRPWMGIDKRGSEKDGECDFVVAHPQYGYLAIEVKGGGVSKNPANDQWISIDRMGYRNVIKDPVEQAKKSKYEILRKLKQTGRIGQKYIRTSHGVVLPDSVRPDGDMGIAYPVEIFCFLDNFQNGLYDWIISRMTHGEADDLGIDGVEALTDLLAKPFHLHQPLGHILDETVEIISTLTQDQYHILEEIEDIDRAAISGGAGTGKTVLAIEEAKRLANEGNNVLITCFSGPLAYIIQNKLNDCPNIIVLSFHKLCDSYVKRAEIEIPGGISMRDLLKEVYPELLSKAVSKNNGPFFGAIIIDEGQDFLLNWWYALEKLLDRTIEKNRVRIFFDSNQKIFGDKLNIPQNYQAIPIRLVQNLRNTKNIFRYVDKYYEGYKIKSIGPEGPIVDFIQDISFLSLKHRIHEKILIFTSRERIPPEDIAILVPDEAYLKNFIPNLSIGGKKCARSHQRHKDTIVVETIRKFKGLESPVVILIIDPQTIDKDELLYVGFSRAMTHLIISGDDKSIAVIKARIESSHKQENN